MNKRQRGLIFFVASVALLFSSQYGFAETQWKPDVRLTEDLIGYAFTSTDRSIAAGPGNRVHVVWNNDLHVNLEIFYKSSEDGGETWGDEVQLTYTRNGSDSWNQAIAAGPGNRVHVVWQDSRNGNLGIYYKLSEDGGKTWGNDVRLTGSGASPSWFPSIATDDYNRVHVVWQEQRGNTFVMFYKRSVDGGKTWGGDVQLTVNNNNVRPPVYPYPSIAAGSQNMVDVVWSDSRDGNFEIYHKRSEDGGVTWSEDTRVTFNDTESRDPSIAIDSNNRLHLAWQDYRYGFRGISYKSSVDGGQTWGNSVWLTENGINSVDPSIAVDSQGRAHVVWYDYVIEGREIDYKIYYRRSSPAGRSWEEDDVLLVDNGYTSDYPSIATGLNNEVHVVWRDSRDQNAEIYYKQGTQETPWKIFGPVHR